MHSTTHRPLSRRLDRCDRVIHSEAKDPFGGNVYYITMQMTLFTPKFRNVQLNLHCDVVHITVTTKWAFRLTLDCNGVFAIKAYGISCNINVHLRLFQYIGWYDEDSLGGLEETMSKLIQADPSFGTHLDHILSSFTLLLYLPFIFLEFFFFHKMYACARPKYPKQMYSVVHLQIVIIDIHVL